MQSTPGLPVEHVPPVWQSMIAGFTGVQPGQMQPIVAVDHIMVGWQATMIRYCQEQYPERRVVVHFTIGRAGRIVQHLSIFDPGLHVGAIQRASWPGVPRGATSANPWALGWEHEGFSLPLTASDGASIRAATWSDANPWPEAMIVASLATKVWAWRHAPTLGPPGTALIGHYELDGINRVNDPAAASDRSVWPRQRFIAGVQAALAVYPGAREEEYVDMDYTVIRPGEWLSKVATRVGIPLAQLAALNQIADPNQVTAYQVLRLHDRVPLPDPPLPPAPSVNLPAARTLARQTREAAEAALTLATNTEQVLG